MIRPALLVLAAFTLRAATPVWIDTDPSVEAAGHEVDDGFALVQEFHLPELDIRGVRAVFGNAPIEKAFPIGQEIARRFGPPPRPCVPRRSGPAPLPRLQF